ncbi:glycosyl hydrolase-like protein, partial [Aureobasidium melanogenum]
MSPSVSKLRGSLWQRQRLKANRLEYGARSASRHAIRAHLGEGQRLGLPCCRCPQTDTQHLLATSTHSEATLLRNYEEYRPRSDRSPPIYSGGQTLIATDHTVLRRVWLLLGAVEEFESGSSCIVGRTRIVGSFEGLCYLRQPVSIDLRCHVIGDSALIRYPASSSDPIAVPCRLLRPLTHFNLSLALRKVVLGQEHLGRRILRCRAGRRERQLEDTVLEVEAVRHNTSVCRCLSVFEAFIRSTDNVLFSIDGLIDVSPEALPSEYDGDSGFSVALSTSGDLSPQYVVVRIHCERLAGKIASFVSVFVVHVVWNTNLCEDSRTRTHLLFGFFTQILEIGSCGLSGKAIGDMRENLPFLCYEGDTIVEVRSKDSLRVIIFRAFDRRWNLKRRDSGSTRSLACRFEDPRPRAGPRDIRPTSNRGLFSSRIANHRNPPVAKRFLPLDLRARCQTSLPRPVSMDWKAVGAVPFFKFWSAGHLDRSSQPM